MQNLRVQKEDARGKGYFTLLVWAWDKEEKGRRDTPFTFVFENDQVYYLGNDKEARKDLVRFSYKDREHRTEKELTVSPKNKESAIQDAIDYLEWMLSKQGKI